MIYKALKIKKKTTTKTYGFLQAYSQETNFVDQSINVINGLGFELGQPLSHFITELIF
jgi:hypothetical protein